METATDGRINSAGRNDRTATDKSEKYSKIKSKIDGFAESCQVLLKVLEEVRDIHPFLGAAVVAFKAVVTLELKRRENNDKVILLLVKVQDLMESLVQLRAIPSGQKTADQQLTVEDKLASLCARIERDIQECGNLCDTFSKKRFLVKLLKGPIYEIRLAEMGQTLEERRRELEHALLLFTARGIQSTNNTLNTAHNDINMLLLLQMLQSSAEREFMDIVNLKGGPSKCMQDENILVELIQIRRGYDTLQEPRQGLRTESSARGPGPIRTTLSQYEQYEPSPYHSHSTSNRHGMFGSRHTSRRNTLEDAAEYFSDPSRSFQQPHTSGAKPPGSAASWSHSYYRQKAGFAYNSHRKNPTHIEIKQLKEELAKDVDAEVKQNQATFLRKLQEQQRQLLVIERTVVKQGDRVVREVHRGPHDRIHDEELRSIWKEMGWKLVVPAVEFVRTLHDYFISQHQDMQILDDHFNRPPEPGSTAEIEMAALSRALTAAKQRSEEKWALKCLHYTKLQPLTEAFDADSSAFVSVWEANQMLSLRPNGWSLLQWLAYWASGRHFAITQYSNKINEILQNMHLLLRHKVRPVNYHTVNRYLDGMKILDRVLATTIPCDVAPAGELADRVSRYTQNEEERMEYILQALNYEIDGSDTIELITSGYQIERNFSPLIYLLLRRHLWVIRLACDVTLDVREMDTATQTLKTIFKAVKDRVSTLEAMSQLSDQTFSRFLQNFAFGMYYGVHAKIDISYPLLEEDGDEEADGITPVPGSWLTHRLPETDETAPHQFYSPEDPIQFESCVGEYVNGYWSGYLTSSYSKIRNRLIQFRISSWKGLNFEGDGNYSEGIIRIKGCYDSNTNVLKATIVGSADSRSDSGDSDLKVFILGWVDTISCGHFGKQYQISGAWMTSKEGSTDSEGSITLSQTPAWTYQFRQGYSAGRKASERWRFALQAVLYRVRSECGVLNRAFCVEKLKTIRRSVYFLKQRLLIGAVVDREDEITLSRLAPSDSRLCRWLARFSLWPTFHFNAKCDCGKPIFGSRLLQMRVYHGSVGLGELCQHRGLHPLVTAQEARIKTVQFIHKRDKLELSDAAESLTELLFTLSERAASPEIPLPNVFSNVRQSPISSRHRQGSFGNPQINGRASASALSCVCCGISLPDEKRRAVWVCLACSVPGNVEQLLIMCGRCEFLNRRCMDVRFPTHSPYHSLLHLKPWFYQPRLEHEGGGTIPHKI
ncbi:hypothetical protein E1B28_013275 [Marasmius oreades]|uniref:Uncharacterized protein n=1 Tax=Marasmius oreades TaxID=181124 RepID=A0A9P7RPJ7_9AGAR|nr:uncharacterized protein E1B28_013275 [Marasmius oreades]KAG7087297.1 hypothetical protein E1B28_013275 [Marasmius oreades]